LLYRQDRRVDGFPFILKDHSLAKARTIGFPPCPIGLPTTKPFVALVEGSSDLLAAYALAYAEDMDTPIAPVTILGAANHIHPTAIDDFLDKRVLAFPDYDSAGINGVDRWKNQLIFHFFIDNIIFIFTMPPTSKWKKRRQ
jgi:hypothetical protein